MLAFPYEGCQARTVLHEVQRPPTIVERVVTPGSLDDALLAIADEHTKPIAGGTDLLVELDRAEHRGLTTLVDLTRIPGLDRIDVSDGVVTIGPLVTHNQCVANPDLRLVAVPLVQACWEIGSPQLRNRATIVGNVVTASPANDTLSALVALDAEVTVASRRRTDPESEKCERNVRHIPISEFVRGVRQTLLADDELVTAISFPALEDTWHGVFLKLGLRSAQAISVVHLGLVCRFDPTGPQPGGRGSPVVAEARLALGSVAPTIVRADDAEQVLIGRELTDEVIANAADAGSNGLSPIDDLRATAEYRSHLVVEMIRRALGAVRDGVATIPTDPPLLWGSPAGRVPTGAEYAAEHGPETLIESSVNGHPVSAVGAGTTMLDWLRSTGATGTKEGCAEGECGSCTVNLDGATVLSCLVPATRANGAEIITVEGLDHPIQRAFIDAGAVQCGFCIPGFLMSGSSLVDEHDRLDNEKIVAGLSGNLCRCTGYYKIMDAVRSAAGAGSVDR